jgi:hypothetical protein
MVQLQRSRVSQTVTQGVLVGIAGGLAEIAWIGSYGSLAGTDAAEVARAVSATVGRILPNAPFAAAPVFYGIAIHMIAAMGIGVALAFLWRWTRAYRPSHFNEYGFMLSALAIIWAVNFFVVLPLISPAFVDLMPYPVSLASKLLFGVAAASVLRYTSIQLTPTPVRVHAC